MFDSLVALSHHQLQQSTGVYQSWQHIHLEKFEFLGRLQGSSADSVVEFRQYLHRVGNRDAFMVVYPDPQIFDGFI